MNLFHQDYNMVDYNVDCNNIVCSSSEQGISIIVPVYERVALCRKLLESYVVMQMPSIPCEFLLVDNSIHLDSSEKLRALAEQFGVVYLHSEKGIVKARNEGARNAKYRYLFFVDSDCTLDRNVLLEYERLVTKEDPACAAGKTEFRGKESIWWKGIKDMVYFYPFRWCEWDLELTWAPSCNLMIRADVFNEIGGFQVVLVPKEASEDVDICQRIINSGYKIAKCPFGIVYHTTDTWNKLSSIVTRFFRFGVGQAELIIKHKEHINVLPSTTNIFWMLALLALVFSVLGLWKVVMIMAFLMVVNPLAFLLVQYLRLRKSNSLWSLIMHFLIEFFYDSGKLFHSIRKGRFFFFRNYVYSDEMVMGLWKKNVDEYVSYIISLATLIVIICLQ